MKSNNPFDAIKAHSRHNEIEILQSRECGCFFCRQIYDARKVEDWINIDGGVSALCPVCGMDAVIGDASGVPMDKPLLKSLNLTYYGKDFIENNPDAARIYCDRYMGGEITHKKENETLFMGYLESLAKVGDEKACYNLALYNEKGWQFHPADPAKAFYYYNHPNLAFDPKALCRIGAMYESGAVEGRPNYEAAYQHYNKALACGSIEAVYHIFDCYYNGLYVARDDDFAFHILYSCYPEIYARFAFDKENFSEFADIAWRIARCVAAGRGTTRDEQTCLRFYLLAELGMVYREAFEPGSLNKGIWSDIEKQIATIAKNNSLKRQHPVLDADTFFDTFCDIYDFNEKKTFRQLSFDKEEGKLEFELECERPPLLVDTSSLAAAFGEPVSRWSFSGVSRISVEGDGVFNKINPLTDEDWTFAYVDADGNERIVVTIEFAQDQKEIKKQLRALKKI